MHHKLYLLHQVMLYGLDDAVKSIKNEDVKYLKSIGAANINLERQKIENLIDQMKAKY